MDQQYEKHTAVARSRIPGQSGVDATPLARISWLCMRGVAVPDDKSKLYLGHAGGAVGRADGADLDVREGHLGVGLLALDVHRVARGGRARAAAHARGGDV